MNIKHVKANLFNYSHTHVLAHCIASDAIMRAGIAKQFRRLKDVSEIDSLAKDNQLEVGQAYLSKNIIYLVTKKSSYGKPTRVDFNRSLLALRELVKDHNIKRLAIPRIGAGLDRLNWNQTELSIRQIFKDIDVEIVICSI